MTVNTINARGATATFARWISSAGQSVGYFLDASGKFHGYLVTPTQ